MCDRIWKTDHMLSNLDSNMVVLLCVVHYFFYAVVKSDL